MLWCAMHDTYAEALPPFSEREFRHLAAAALSRTAPVADPGAPDTPSDFDLSPELVAEIARAPLAPAAVLIPVVARPELTVLLTQRTDALPRHRRTDRLPRRAHGSDRRRSHRHGAA